MVDTKIARPRDGRQKNKSPKEGTDRELYGWHEITRQIDGWHKNNSPRGWTDRELVGSKLTCQRDGLR